MFSHAFVGISDFDRALAFYNPLMAALGIAPRFCERDRPWAGWGNPIQGQGRCSSSANLSTNKPRSPAMAK